ncbi:rust resistance kinase Lr10-like [Panicum virgatum]|uniref:Protein kinase domain-containing protein n=1 Tax=Panicum virgatum TaxID=38727 RepID=A0A8T0RS46_PANVG|nr:rust resistance kinase Lr10-like [Panicum virgatum]KAG2587363.1 hypothetical protein PVAP13_5NG142800 [Panicum virgatum]
MCKALAAALVLSVLNYGITMATASSDENFFQNCPASSCREGGPEIRFPFRLETSPPSCGAPGMKLRCSKEADTILVHPNLGLCKVIAIEYRYRFIDVIPLAASNCPLQKIISTNLSTDVYRPYGDLATLVSCSTEFRPRNQDRVVGPISCLSNTSEFPYLVSSFQPMDVLPLDCMVVSKDIWIPYILKNEREVLFNETAKVTIAFGKTMFRWSVPNITNVCQDCEIGGRPCGFRSETRQAFCKKHRSHVKVIAATSSVAMILVASVIVSAALYLALKSKYNEEIHLKVEMFLNTYSTSKPTRYTFSEVKKITRRFNNKLGQGGFGSVYKGELSNGVPVAVKVLENSKGEGQEFINEIATIGTIHHANVVRLLGFCSEGSRRALIYEFMPNASLEKYIFSQASDTCCREKLIPNRMLEIATGIAKGIEYLHQGCKQRILHFDIKPSNILLDYSFKPKVSDFGLAKLCARDQSIVTVTAARGTMGYIAPELYSRNFGMVSYKSDVYSFGMVVLEMMTGQSSSDPQTENKNDVYIPEWVYDKIITGQELELIREITQEEKDIMRKLAIIALWCIQWNPANRPSMTKVVNMLTDSLKSLKMPPKPFVSSFG